MIEHLPAGVVCLVPLGTADIEVQLLGGRIHRAGRRIARLRKNRQGLAVAHALRHHEVDLVVLVEGLPVQGRRPGAPPGDVEQALGPVCVTATGVAVLIEESGDPAVLARIELHDFLEGDHVDPLRQLEFGPEGSGVFDLVDGDLDGPAHLAEVRGVVAHVVPGALVVQRARLEDSAARQDETSVVEIVLLRSVDPHRGAGLRTRTGRFDLRIRNGVGLRSRAAPADRKRESGQESGQDEWTQMAVRAAQASTPYALRNG